MFQGIQAGPGGRQRQDGPRGQVERLVIEQLKARVLAAYNLEELVKLVSEEPRAASCGLTLVEQVYN